MFCSNFVFQIVLSEAYYSLKLKFQHNINHLKEFNCIKYVYISFYITPIYFQNESLAFSKIIYHDKINLAIPLIRIH